MKLTQAQATQLSELMKRERALGQMTETFQREFEKRSVALQTDSQKFWDDMTATYGIDRERVLYVASQDGTELLPQQVLLAPPRR